MDTVRTAAVFQSSYLLVLHFTTAIHAQLLFQQEHIQLLYERTYCIFSFSLSKAGLDKITRL
jgi:hypothetical protein